MLDRRHEFGPRRQVCVTGKIELISRLDRFHDPGIGRCSVCALRLRCQDRLIEAILRVFDNRLLCPAIIQYGERAGILLGENARRADGFLFDSQIALPDRDH
ncbi:hypothetical protein NKH61_27720 [Mesorhizobium sp. M1005]|uniref:hypothetical protein n=1 Tax=unclassified Mesorhizobium TaxID=325217 RepID=UPI003334A7F0